MEPQAPPPCQTPSMAELNFDNLRALKILGKGAMGTVFLVHDLISDPTARSPFALKVVDKTILHTRRHADRRARWEIRALTLLSSSDVNPFLPKLLGSIETNDLLAWAIPYCTGGDLNVLRYRQSDRVFSPAVIRFYLAEIVCAIEHLHAKGIVYRDLKPENVLVQQSGHIILTDFDLSRRLSKRTPIAEQGQTQNNQVDHHRKQRMYIAKWIPVLFGSKTGLKRTNIAQVSPVTRQKSNFRSNSFVGTEEYVSPEMVRDDGHEFAVDWWALGVLAYEMMYGTTPFKGKTRKETFHNVLTVEPEFPGKPNPLTELIGRLLAKDPTKRLGYNRGAREIKEHVFFHGVKWDLLTDVLRPPYIPSKEEGVLTDRARNGGVVIRDYLEKQKQPVLPPPSPLTVPSSKVSFSEY